MGEFTISTSMTAFVWLVSIGIIAINLFIVGGFLVDEGNAADGGGGWLYAIVGVGASLYLGFILFLMRQDLQKLRRRAGSLFLKLGGHDWVGGHVVSNGGPSSGVNHVRPQRIPSEDDGGSLQLEGQGEVGGS